MKKLLVFIACIALAALLCGCSVLNAMLPSGLLPDAEETAENAGGDSDTASEPDEAPIEEVPASQDAASDDPLCFTWMGYGLRLTEFREPGTNEAPWNYQPSGTLRIATFECVNGTIPTDFVMGNADACFYIQDTGGTLDVLDSPIVSDIVYGVKFDSETGEFSTDEMQEKFSLLFDIHGDIPDGELLVCVGIETEPYIKEIPVSLVLE